MKKIISFTVEKEETIDSPETTVNEAGDTVTTVKKVKKNIPYNFFVRTPNRTLIDDASLFYNVKIAEGIKAGLLTIPQLEKRNLNDGGVLSDDQKKRFQDLVNSLYANEQELQMLGVKKPEEMSDEEKQQREKLIAKLAEVKLEINDYESLRSSIYENTAEFRARNYTIVWWLLFLSYHENGEPYFGPGKYDEKLVKYDEINEGEDEFNKKVLTKFITYVSLWATNRVSTEADFKKFEELMAAKDKL